MEPVQAGVVHDAGVCRDDYLRPRSRMSRCACSWYVTFSALQGIPSMMRACVGTVPAGVAPGAAVPFRAPSSSYGEMVRPRVGDRK
jgi:hypothetical protein